MSPQNIPVELAVRARDVGKMFGRDEVLRQLSVDIPAGEVVCIIGPSGAGKSTFLRCINHLERISSGQLEVFGERIGYRRKGNRLHELAENDIARQRARIGMVFQRFNLFPHLTVLENLILAPTIVHQRSRAEATEEARRLLARVGLPEKEAEYPARLSGGQQQRIAIARALMMSPRLMLFDEPTSALDPETVGEVLNIMEDLAREQRSMIVVTHELGFARRAADRLIFMVDGSIDAIGPTAELLDNPPTERLARFVASVLH